jgi:DNA (cytosine-5)-methyltransferase 1
VHELALFAGAGGGILGGKLLGWRTVCAVERDAYAASVLVARQNEGLLPAFPIWDDVRTFDGRPWRGIVDVVSGGFPCQDISVAGGGAGIEGKRSGLWSEMARIVGDVRPRFVFVENSPAIITRGLGRVLGDLAALGYDCRWTVLGAADVGAPHRRDRFWLVAHAEGERLPPGRANRREKSGFAKPANGSEDSADVANTNRLRESQQKRSERAQRGRAGHGGEEMADADSERREELRPAAIANGMGQLAGCIAEIGSAAWWRTEPDVGRVADGVAARVDRLRAIGNGQVPLCAATAWRILTEESMQC